MMPIHRDIPPHQDLPPHRRSRHRPRKRRADVLPPQFADSGRGVRIQRVLAAAGVASRRHCEVLIRQGQVTVNGQRVLALPAWVDPVHDRIEVAGRLLAKPRGAAPSMRRSAGSAPATGSPRADALSAGHLYVMLHKPRRVVSTAYDPEGRRTVTDLVQLEGAQGPVRLFPVGRLDADSTGLILLTNDGELANRLTHPRYGVAKEYLVSLKGLVSENDLRQLRDGLLLTQRTAGSGDLPSPASRADRTGRGHSRPGQPGSAPIRVKRAAVEGATIVRQDRGQAGAERTILRLILREGQNREVRRLLARLGFKVHRLRRVGIGGLNLKGLSSGHWRFLKSSELHGLKSAVGL
jgi:pseudouridine synthase